MSKPRASLRRTLDPEMASIPEDLYRELVDEFGGDADRVASRALRSELTRHRISRAIANGRDPAVAVADALSRDPDFVRHTDELTQQRQEPGSLEERRQRWG